MPAVVPALPLQGGEQRPSIGRRLLRHAALSGEERARKRGGSFAVLRRDVHKLTRQRRRLHCIVAFAVAATALAVVYYAYALFEGGSIVLAYVAGHCGETFCRETHGVQSLLAPTLLRLAAAFWGLQSVWNIRDDSTQIDLDAAWRAGGTLQGGAPPREGCDRHDASQQRGAEESPPQQLVASGALLSDPWSAREDGDPCTFHLLE